MPQAYFDGVTGYYGGRDVWVCPTGITQARVQCWGRGGNGWQNSVPAGGGGGGAYAEDVVAVEPGVVYKVNVAVQGAGDPYTFFITETGWLAGGTPLVRADYGREPVSGGSTAPGGAAGNVLNCIGSVVYGGGVGGGIDSYLPYRGGGGGGAGSAGAGSQGQGGTSNGAGGSGGAPDGGNGGDASSATPGDAHGVFPGGGGAGYGAGAGGLVIIEWGESIQDFNSPGESTWTAPDGVTQITVRAWGGGGGGARGYWEQDSLDAYLYAGGGGGGGAFSQAVVAVTPGQTYTLYVGSGGVGGDVSTAPGSGQSTYFEGSVIAVGGNPGSSGVNNYGGIGGLASDSIGSVKYDGGDGSVGETGTYLSEVDVYGGGGGGGAGASGAGLDGTIINGGFGGTPDGGAGGDGDGGAGSTAGSLPGGGGGGGYATSGNVGDGSAGGNGAISISWENPEITGSFPADPEQSYVGEIYTFLYKQSLIGVQVGDGVNSLLKDFASLFAHIGDVGSDLLQNPALLQQAVGDVNDHSYAGWRGMAIGENAAGSAASGEYLTSTACTGEFTTT